MLKIAKSLPKETRLYNFGSLVESVYKINMQCTKIVLIHWINKNCKTCFEFA